MCIGQTPHRKTGQHFVSLMSGRMVRRNQHAELPVPDKAIDTSNEMVRKQGQHWTHNGEPIISTRRESNVTDVTIEPFYDGDLTDDGETDDDILLMLD